MTIRFRKINEDEAEAIIATGHRVRRDRAYFRLGGWQYTFSCSCGWKGQRDGFGAGKTHARVRQHRNELLRAAEHARA